MGMRTAESDASCQEAAWWERDGERVHCLLCPQDCHIAEGRAGICRVRENVDGTLRAINYAQVTSVALDPIEKKPLYHFHPGSWVLSLGTFGCNLSCQFCQNYTISQGRPAAQTMSPEEAVRAAQDTRSRGNIGIAYTYSEPIVWYEYVRATSKLAHEAGLKNVLITNGLIREEPLEELLPLIDAMNVDIKAMDDEFYRTLCGARSGETARRTVELAWGRCSVEITNLLVTDENDDAEQVRELVDWAASVSPDLPLHLSAYRPMYRMTAPPTPLDRIKRAAEIARERLNYVYVGNVVVDGGGDTVCPGCGDVVVRRSGYNTDSRLTGDGACPGCGRDVNVTV